MHRPTLRIATPIFADDGKLFGLFMINVDMRRAFDRIRSSTWPGETIYVVNRQGDYLIHPDRSREFGSVLGKPTDWKVDFPHLAAQAGATQGSADIIPDQTARSGGIALAPALLAGTEWVGVIETIPHAAIMAPAASIRNTSLLVGAIAVLCAAVLAVLIARSLTRPIVQLTEAVQRVASKGKVVIPVDAGGETGVLARAFAKAIEEINTKTAALQQEVQEHRRTVAARDHHAERERLFSAAVESSNDAIITTSLDGTITGWNSAAERLYGHTAAEAAGKNISSSFPSTGCRRYRTRCAGSVGANASNTTKPYACERMASRSTCRSAFPRSRHPPAQLSASRRWRATSRKTTRPSRCCGNRPRSCAASSRRRRI